MKPLIFTPCEKVLQDPQSGVSLIAIFQEIKIQITHDAPELPRDAVIPREWLIYSRFDLDMDEEGEEFTAVTTILWPDGALFATQSLTATQPTQSGMSFVIKLMGFPMGQNGSVKIQQSVTKGGEIVCGPMETKIKVNVGRELPPPQLQ